MLNIFCGNIKLHTVVNSLRHGECVLNHRQDADAFTMGVAAVEVIGHGCGEDIFAIASESDFAALGGEVSAKRLGERNALVVLTGGPLHRQNIIVAVGSEINGGIGVGKGGKFKADGQHGKHLASVLAFVQKYPACFIGDSRHQLIDTGSLKSDGAAIVCEAATDIGRPILKTIGVIHQPLDGETVQIGSFSLDHHIGVGMGVLWQAVAYSRHRIYLETLLIAVASAAIIGKLRFQDIAALGVELQLSAAIAQRTLCRIGEGHLFAVTQQRPSGGMASDLPEHRFYYHGFVGVEDFGQIKSRGAYRIDGDARGTGKHSAGCVSERSSQCIHAFSLETNAAIGGVSFNPCADFGGFAISGQGVGQRETIRFFCFCL